MERSARWAKSPISGKFARKRLLAAGRGSGTPHRLRPRFANISEVIATMRRKSLSTKLAPHLRSKCFGWLDEVEPGEVRLAGRRFSKRARTSRRPPAMRRRQAFVSSFRRAATSRTSPDLAARGHPKHLLRKCGASFVERDSRRIVATTSEMGADASQQGRGIRLLLHPKPALPGKSAHVPSLSARTSCIECAWGSSNRYRGGASCPLHRPRNCPRTTRHGCRPRRRGYAWPSGRGRSGHG